MSHCVLYHMSLYGTVRSSGADKDDEFISPYFRLPCFEWEKGVKTSILQSSQRCSKVICTKPF